MINKTIYIVFIILLVHTRVSSAFTKPLLENNTYSRVKIKHAEVENLKESLELAKSYKSFDQPELVRETMENIFKNHGVTTPFKLAPFLVLENLHFAPDFNEVMYFLNTSKNTINKNILNKYSKQEMTVKFFKPIFEKRIEEATIHRNKLQLIEETNELLNVYNIKNKDFYTNLALTEFSLRTNSHSDLILYTNKLFQSHKNQSKSTILKVALYFSELQNASITEINNANKWVEHIKTKNNQDLMNLGLYHLNTSNDDNAHAIFGRLLIDKKIDTRTKQNIKILLASK